MKRLVLVLLLVTAGYYCDDNKDSQDGDDVIVAHDSWQEADVEASEGGHSHENVKTVQFTLDDAVTVPTPDTSAPVEDEATARAREQYEMAEQLLKVDSSDRSAWSMVEQSALTNYAPATLRLAWAYLTGVRFNINAAAAHTLFKSLADQGNPEAQMGMGFLYATGTVVNSSQSQALLYYTFGAFGGSAWAQMALGYRYGPIRTQHLMTLTNQST